METILSQRNEAFISCCREILRRRRATGAPLVFANILDDALNAKPKSHYIDFITAMREMYYLRSSGGVSRKKQPLTIAQWRELYEQVTDVAKRRPTLSFPAAVAFTLTYRRPSRFFIPRRTAHSLLIKAIRLENLFVIA